MEVQDEFSRLFTPYGKIVAQDLVYVNVLSFSSTTTTAFLHLNRLGFYSCCRCVFCCLLLNLFHTSTLQKVLVI